MTTPPSKWLPLYRALKLNNYNLKLRPHISKMIRESDHQDHHHLPTLIDYYKATAKSDQIMKECYPVSVLDSQELLKRVAGVVGLQLPKEFKIESSK